MGANDGKIGGQVRTTPATRRSRRVKIR